MRKVKIDYTISGFNKFAQGELLEETSSHVKIRLFDGTERTIRKDSINEMAELRNTEVRNDESRGT